MLYQKIVAFGKVIVYFIVLSKFLHSNNLKITREGQRIDIRKKILKYFYLFFQLTAKYYFESIFPYQTG